MKFNKLILGALMFVSSVAYADKVTRDYISNTVNPIVAKAKSTMKQSCGCDVAIDIKFDTYKSKDELYSVGKFIEKITEGAPAYCKDAPSKTAICKLKTVKISYQDASPTFVFSSGVGAATTDASSFPSWEMITSQVDK